VSEASEAEASDVATSEAAKVTTSAAVSEAAEASEVTTSEVVSKAAEASEVTTSAAVSEAEASEVSAAKASEVSAAATEASDVSEAAKAEASEVSATAKAEASEVSATAAKKCILNNDIFMDKYAKMFEKTIVDLVTKTYKVQWNNVFFAKDCPREEIWRHSHTDEYKGTRVAHSSFDAGIFTYTFGMLLPRLIEKYGFRILQSESLEADDVIALTVKYIVPHEKTCIIITNDNDYVQLCDNPNISVINLQNKNVFERTSCASSQEYLQVKIIQGDKSDNIPSIGPGIGPKTALKLAKTPDELEKYFKKHPDAVQRYNVNRRLIDFNFIEQGIKDQFVHSYSNLI
jgi:5'-3' exonuclease